MVRRALEPTATRSGFSKLRSTASCGSRTKSSTTWPGGTETGRPEARPLLTRRRGQRLPRAAPVERLQTQFVIVQDVRHRLTFASTLVELSIEVGNSRRKQRVISSDLLHEHVELTPRGLGLASDFPPHSA